MDSHGHSRTLLDATQVVGAHKRDEVGALKKLRRSTANAQLVDLPTEVILHVVRHMNLKCLLPAACFADVSTIEEHPLTRASRPHRNRGIRQLASF